MRSNTPAERRAIPPPERELKWLSAGFPRVWPPARWLRWRLPEFEDERGYRYFIPDISYRVSRVQVHTTRREKRSERERETREKREREREA